MNSVTQYGIPESDLDALLSELKKNSKINEIILFGSRAKGTFRNGSDIDIALKGRKLKLNDILDATLDIDKLLLPYKLDLVIYTLSLIHISEPTRLGMISYAVFCLKKKKKTNK